jgi:hypothetical protein
MISYRVASTLIFMNMFKFFLFHVHFLSFVYKILKETVCCNRSCYLFFYFNILYVFLFEIIQR